MKMLEETTISGKTAAGLVSGGWPWLLDGGRCLGGEKPMFILWKQNLEHGGDGEREQQGTVISRARRPASQQAG